MLILMLSAVAMIVSGTVDASLQRPLHKLSESQPVIDVSEVKHGGRNCEKNFNWHARVVNSFLEVSIISY